MKVNSKKLKDNKVKVDVSFTKEEIDDAISKKYLELSKKYKFPGFRPGKAPRPVIDNMFTKDGVLAQVTDDLVNDNYPLSIDQANLFPVGQPDFGKEKAKLVEAGKEYKFTYNIEVEPTYELSSYDNVEISLPSDKATEKDIKAQLDQFREHYFSYVDAGKDEKAKKDSSLSLNIKSYDDDKKEIDTLTNDALNYHMGSKFLPDEFEKKLIGAKAGDKLSFTIKIPETPTVYTQALKDKTKNIKFDITVNSIQIKKLPEINDEFAKKNMGFETLKELKEQIKNQVEQEKARMLPVLKENKCMEELGKRLDVELPKSVCEKKEQQLLQDFFTQLQQNGMTFDMYLQQQNIDADKFKADLKKQAKDVAKQDAALDAYAANKKIKVSQEEIEEEFKHGDPKNWKDLYNDWKKRGELHIVVQAISRMKAAKDLVDNAKVNTESDKSSSKKGTKQSKK